MITVHITGKAEDYILAQASVHHCMPEQIAAALFDCTADADLASAILDGTDPRGTIATRPRRASLQVRVIQAMKLFETPSGTILASNGDLAKALNTTNRGAVRNAVHGLMKKRLVDLIKQGQAACNGAMPTASRYRLTDQGRAFLKEIGR